MKLNLKKCEYEGKLITFCGLDGCGKTTIIQLLRDYLEELGLSVMLTKQPTSEVRRSKIFRTFMDEKEHNNFEYRALSLIAAADRVQHSNQVILPELVKGKTVISDRYFYSCLANLQARGYENDLWIYEIAGSIPKPDIAFFLDVDVDTAIKRVRQRPEEKDSYIDIELQYKLRENYLKIARENDGIIIQSFNSPIDTFEQLKVHIQTVLRNSSIKSPQTDDLNGINYLY